MKRDIFYIFIAGLILSLSGCADFWDNLTNNSNSSPESNQYGTQTATDTGVKANYTSGSPITVAASTKTLTVTGSLLGGKTVYLAKTNPTATLIKGDHSRAVTSASSNITLNTSKRVAEAGSETTSQNNSCGSLELYERLKNATFRTPISARASSTKAQSIDRSSDQLPREIGTKKEIWTDTNYMQSWEKKTAALRAIGEYCNVWVVSDCWGGNTASGKRIDNTIAQKMATFFDDVYLLETNLYGKESDQIFYVSGSTTNLTYNSFQLEAMEYLSDTGTKVNLVVYDIADDYGKSLQSGTLGYFSQKDYYPNLDDLNTMLGMNVSKSDYALYTSNEGKYLYIDAPSCVEALANVMTIITHEYQHLITWGCKTMNHFKTKGYITADSAYYEMMAMVGEDFMKEYTIDHYASDGFSTDNTPFTWRLPNFNEKYFYSGIEYRDDSDNGGKYTSSSYATNYTFGAWLARNYGNAAMMRHIVNSTDTDYFTAVINSIKETAGSIVSIESLLSDFAYDCIVSKNDAGFRKYVELESNNVLYCTDKSYGYPLTKVDLYNLESYGVSPTYTTKENGKTVTKDRSGMNGPYFFESSYVATSGIRPYGMELNKVGTIATGATSITLTFNDTSASTLKTYLIIE